MGSDDRPGDRPGDTEASPRQERKAAYVRLWRHDAPSDDKFRDFVLWAIWQTLEDINEALRAKAVMVPNEPQMRPYSKRERERINQSMRVSGVSTLYRPGEAL